MTILVAIGIFVLGYFLIGALAAYLIGRYEPYGPSWGALIWPIILPTLVVMKIYDRCHKKGMESRE